MEHEILIELREETPGAIAARRDGAAISSKYRKELRAAFKKLTEDA